MSVKPGMTVEELIEAMASSGVLGAGRLARAARLLAEIFSQSDYQVFMAVAGPAVPGGLRLLLSSLVEKGLVNLMVTTGANVTHDLVEALGFKHWQGSLYADDRRLKAEGYGRVGDIYVEQKAFEALEKEVYRVLDEVSSSRRGEPFAVYELLWEFGSRFKCVGEGFLLKAAWKRKVPIFCPGIYDSMLGFHLWNYAQLKGLSLNMARDLSLLADKVFEAEKVGVVILGGGLPKHHVLGACMLRGGVDAAIQITLDRPEGGSLSGAALEEAVSWSKAKEESRLVTVIGDYTQVFPLMVAYALSKLK
ncbi:MAG: deoxyhypusine synthase [Candidatus Hecatellales archaeon]|nr:MAG: deoxyhypusine synthase [Candidatus Hecatellales archaeon]